MKKQKLLFTFSLILVLIGINIINVSAENNNILNNSGSWKSYFGSDNSWGNANGELNSTDDNNFEIDINSTGSIQNEWTIQAQFHSTTSLNAGKHYLYTANIISDKNRTIYVKVQGELDSDIIAEKWVTLKAGEYYNLSIEFFSKKDYSNFKLFYGVGWNTTSDTIGANQSNNIKVTDINIIPKELDYTKFTYQNILNDTVDASQYKYHNIIGLNSNDKVIAKKYPNDSTINSIYFPLSIAPVAKVTVNGDDVDFYTNGGALVYITLDKFYKDYNEILIFNNTEIISKIIVKNNAKIENIEEIKSYLNDNVSDNIKKLIENTIKDVNNAKTNDEVNQILDNLPKIIETIKLQDTKDSTIEKINTYLTNDASDNVKKIIETAINDINSITTRDEVDARLQIFINDITLQINKETAIEELKEYIGNKYSDEIKNIYEDAIKKINETTSNEETIKIVVKAKSDIDTQIMKENTKEEPKLPDSPLTLDNIIIYIVLLIVAGIAIFYLSKRLLKNKKR